MSKKVISCDVSNDITILAKIMKENDVGFVVITKEEKIIGVMTDRDIVTRSLANSDNKIDGYFTSKIVSINYDNEIDKALELMSKNKIKRLLVTDGDSVCGIISISDIMISANVYDTIKTIWALETNNKEGNVKIDDFKL